MWQRRAERLQPACRWRSRPTPWPPQRSMCWWRRSRYARQHSNSLLRAVFSTPGGSTNSGKAACSGSGRTESRRPRPGAMGQKGSRLLDGHDMDWHASEQAPAAAAAAAGLVWPTEEATVGDWVILKTLGAGAFGRVVLAQRGSGELAAIKLLPRGSRVRQYRTYVAREILHHASLRHPFIISLNEVVLTPRSLAIVMEYAAGGDMFSHLRDRRAGSRLIEAEARWMFQQLAIGLAYCHDRGVANRDLKLENLLLDRPTTGIDGDWPLLKICDFGYSKHELNSTAKTGVGTPLYMAPEVISGAAKYDAKRADIWSCGVILFTILFGQYPFQEDKDFARRIVTGQWAMPEGQAEGLSLECRDLLSRLLVVDPEKRIDMEGIFAHPWFQRDLPEGALAMNTSYLQSAPNLGTCVPLVGQLIEAATIEGSPLDAALSLKLDGSLPAGLVVAAPPRISPTPSRTSVQPIGSSPTPSRSSPPPMH